MSKVVDFILEKSKEVKDRRISVKSFLHREKFNSSYSDNPNISMQSIPLDPNTLDSQPYLFTRETEKSDTSILLIKGLDLYSSFVSAEIFRTQIKLLKSKDIGEKIKIVHIFCFEEQFSSAQYLADLKTESTFLIDFSEVKNLDRFIVSCVNYQESTYHSKEKVAGSIKNGQISFEKHIPENHIIEKKNPDQMIKSTFKLGVSEEQKAEKDRLILPHYKQREIDEMEKKEINDLEEQYDLGIDDEQDEDDDFDV
jgi:hypothetical protein